MLTFLFHLIYENTKKKTFCFFKDVFFFFLKKETYWTEAGTKGKWCISMFTSCVEKVNNKKQEEAKKKN